MGKIKVWGLLLGAAAIGLGGPAFAADAMDVRTATRLGVTGPLDQLTTQVERAHPAAMMYLARRLWDAGRREEAVFWLYEGQLRWRAYLKQKDGRREEGAFQQVFETVGPDINFWAACDVDALAKTIDDVLAWDAAHPDPLVTDSAAKEETRAGLTSLKGDVLESRAEMEAAHKQSPVCRQTSRPPADENAYEGSGGALFGAPAAMVATYDESRFAGFQIGRTTKAEVIKALGAPELWTTEEGGGSRLSYPYFMDPGGLVAMFNMVQRVNVDFVFDKNKVLTAIKVPPAK